MDKSDEGDYDSQRSMATLAAIMGANLPITSQADDAQLLGLVQAATQEVEGDHTRKRPRNVYEEVLTTKPMLETESPVSHNFLQTPRDKSLPLPKVPTIFRPPSTKSRKYSRPTLSSLFTSLELDPLIYTRLEAQAKQYMLDPAHPERREVIGPQRAQGIDEAKLKMRLVTREFLEGGAGKTYWAKDAGVNNQYTPKRTIAWPDDADHITNLVLPLMRKMVSNERQRIYASKVRSVDKEAKKLSESSSQSPGGPNEPLEIEDDEFGSPTANGSSQIPSPREIAEDVMILVNILGQDDRGRTQRLLPRFNVRAAGLTEFVTLRRAIKLELMKLQFTHPQASEVDVDFGQYKAWLENGLADINTDNEWLMALVSCEAVEWMEAELRLLVFV